MKYSMVKQFSNASLDNVFKFFFKIVDFSKLLIEVFWGLFDIVAAFYLIFFNIVMYFYYLFLFIIDRGSESGGPGSYKVRKSSGRFKSRIPKVTITSGPNPIPAMYRVTETAAESVSKVASTAAESTQAVKSTVKSSAAGAKRGFIKPVLEFIADVLIAIRNIIFKPFQIIAEFFSERLKPVKDKAQASGTDSTARASGSNLIDEYMKEYKKGKK